MNKQKHSKHHSTNTINKTTQKRWVHSPHISQRTDWLQRQWTWWSFVPDNSSSSSSSVHVAGRVKPGEPHKCTLRTERAANLVWHLWGPWDNLHDTGTDRRAHIDLKSIHSKIRLRLGVEAATYEPIGLTSVQWSRLWWWRPHPPPHTPPTVRTEGSLTAVRPFGLTSRSLPPSILSCDNRDIPEPAPCLTAGLSLNSSGVWGMWEWRREQPGGYRGTHKRKWKTLINSSLLCLLQHGGHCTNV